MRLLTLFVVALLLSACRHGEDSNNDKWVSGEFMPSANFAKLCESPRQNSDYPDLQGTYADENNWIRSWSHETYLWYNELPDIDPAIITDPIDYFNRMKTSAKTTDGRPMDRFHYAQNTEEYNRYNQAGISAGYGFTYLRIQSTVPRKVLIIFSEPNSPAAANNITRGAEIISIDGEAMSTGNADILNAGLMPKTLGETHTFEILDLNATSTRTVVLKSSEIVTVPVHKQRIIDRDNKKIGYLALNTFLVASAEKQIIDAMNDFNNSQINELVLDLRYNTGGYVSLSADLGTMIAGNTALGSVFTELKFNDKLSRDNLTFRFTSTSKTGLSVAKGSLLPKLNLPRVYILSTVNTASASEYLINGLRGIGVEVILIGTPTTGKPYGWMPSENCGTTYSSIQFKGENAMGYSDFVYGFVPSAVDNGSNRVRGCLVYDDLTQLLGDENERILATALYFIDNNDCPISANNAMSKPEHQLSNIQGEMISRFPATGLLIQ
jgi:C-terminal processing protease CtpA/Prc